MSDIHHPDTTARDTAEQIMRAALANIDEIAVVHHLIDAAGLVGSVDRDALGAAVKDTDDVLAWIASATTEIDFPGICTAMVWYMQGNDWYGADGWTWCRVIDGDPRDNTSDLPRCADQANAVAKATAWLAKQKRVDPAFPAPVVEARIEEPNDG